MYRLFGRVYQIDPYTSELLNCYKAHKQKMGADFLLLGSKKTEVGKRLRKDYNFLISIVENKIRKKLFLFWFHL